jgi:predicted ATPase
MRARRQRPASTAQQLGALVDKSLVVFDAQAGRYALLETVKAFANAKLADADETDEAFQRLCNWLLAEAPGPLDLLVRRPPRR